MNMPRTTCRACGSSSFEHNRPFDAHFANALRAAQSEERCKHLRRIEFLRDGLNREVGTAHPLSRVALRGPFVVRHPRARVAEEERHTFLPAWLLRPFYRRIYERAFRTGLGADSA